MNLLPFALSLLFPVCASAALELDYPEAVVLKTPEEISALYRTARMAPGAQGRLAVMSRSGEIWLWGAGPGKIEHVIKMELGGFLGITPDGAFVASGSRALKKRRNRWMNKVEAGIWDVAKDKLVYTVEGGADGVVSADGSRAAFFHGGEGSDDTVRLRDMKTGKVRTVWSRPENCLETGSLFMPFNCEGVRSVALSPDGSRVLITREQKGGFNKENTVIVVDGNTGKKLRGYADCDSQWEKDWAGAHVAAYSGDGRFLAYAGRYGRQGPCGVVVREADSGAILWTSAEDVDTLAFSPDGSFLIGTRAWDKKGPAVLWDVAKGKTLAPPTSENVCLADFATDGSYLFLALEGKPEILAYRLKGHLAPPVAAAPPAPRAEAAEDVDAPPKTQAKVDPDALAVVIGVERYRQGGIPPVEFAASDAKTVAAYLTQSMGFDAKNVILLADEQATQADLKKYLGPWLENRATEKSRVFVYYAGHGSPDPKSGDSYLMPYEGDPTYIQVTGYPLKELYKTLGALPTKNVLVVLDSCFSGAGQRSLIAAGARPLVNVKAVEPQGATVVLAASAGDQISGSYPEGRHGLLTYFMLKGLRGAADADQDGSVSTRELYDYVRPIVEREARKRNIEQTPLLQGLPAGQEGPAWIGFK
jgi:dipeptidyl aminopeptidase/acylaminoacyl peptidase